MIRSRRRAVVYVAVLVAAGSAWAAVLNPVPIVDFDVQAGSWNDGTRKLTSTVGGYVLTNWEYGREGVLSNWGFVAYNASGAGPQSRAYINWDTHSTLAPMGGDPRADGNILNIAGTAQGYTLEAYFRFDTNFAANNLPPVGANVFGDFSSQFGNNFINITGWGGHPTSSTQTNTGASWSRNETSTNSVSPLFPGGYDGQWHHYVKTHEISGGLSIVRWYLDGQLVITDTTIDAESGGGGPFLSTYPDWDEQFGSIGDLNDRSVQFFGYSLFRVYHGTATDAEVAGLYNAITVIPEPATLGLLAIAGAIAVRRRTPASANKVTADFPMPL